MNNFLCKIFLFLFFLFRFVNFINAQNWTVVGGGPYGGFGKSVGIDNKSNVYSYAFAGDSVTFQDTSFTDGGLLLTKLDSIGEKQWIIRITASWSGWGDMLVDSTGNIYISGVFSDTIAIADTTLILYGDFYHELFLAKFNTDGVLQWARRSDKANDSTLVGSVANIVFSGFDDNGNIQLMLYYLGNLVVLGNDSLNGDGYDHALARIDTNGNFIWNKLINNGAYDFKPALIDPNGNFFLNGTYTSPFPDQSFILKFDFSDTSEWYDASETYLWREPQEGEIVGFDSDSFNNAYAVIRVNADTHFLKKYTTDGSLIWKKQINLKPGSFEAFIVNETGNIVIAAANDTIPNYIPLYIEKYDSAGLWKGKIYLGTRTNSSFPTWVESYNIILDKNDNIYITGDYVFDSNVNSVIFIDDTISEPNRGFFLSKLHSSQIDTTPLSIVNIPFPDDILLFDAFPNPFIEKITLRIYGKINQNVRLTILNIMGEVVFYKELHNLEFTQSIQPDLNSLSPGIYFFQIITQANSITKKIIKQ